jgi:hypothetical protein
MGNEQEPRLLYLLEGWLLLIGVTDKTAKQYMTETEAEKEKPKLTKRDS